MSNTVQNDVRCPGIGLKFKISTKLSSWIPNRQTATRERLREASREQRSWKFELCYWWNGLPTVCGHTHTHE